MPIRSYCTLFAFAISLFLIGCQKHTIEASQHSKTAIQLDPVDITILKTHYPATHLRIANKQPLAFVDIIALHSARISPEATISLLRKSNNRFFLSLGDILQLQNAGISYQVINYMVRSGK